MRRLLLVANPAASGFTASLHRETVELLEPHYRVTPVWPDGPLEAQQAAADAVSEGVDVVVAMGGDGTVHRVANATVGTSTALGVVPAGTTNVFARLAGYPRSARKAAAAIAAATSARRFPTVSIATQVGNTAVDRHAVFAAGVGFDADVIRESERKPLRKVGFGAIHYARSSLSVALRSYRRREPDLRVTVDGHASPAVTAVAQVHDHYTFLGRRALTLSPDGGPAAITIERASPRRLLALLGRSTLHRPASGVDGVAVHHPFRRMIVEAHPAAPFEADGEFLGEVERLTVTVAPGSLLVVTPQ